MVGISILHNTIVSNLRLIQWRGAASRRNEASLDKKHRQMIFPYEIPIPNTKSQSQLLNLYSDLVIRYSELAIGCPLCRGLQRRWDQRSSNEASRCNMRHWIYRNIIR